MAIHGFTGSQNLTQMHTMRAMQAMHQQNVLNANMAKQAAARRSGPTPGTLIIQDSFDNCSLTYPPGPILEPTNAASPHGEQVRHAAQFDGFGGQVVEKHLQEQPGTRDYRRAQTQLLGGSLNQEDARNALNYFMSGKVQGIFDGQAQALNESTNQGVRNSVTNISMGTSKARLVQELYSKPFSIYENNDDPKQKQLAENMIRNQATAFGLDAQKLLSTDPEVHGPERQKLQQKLIKRTNTVIDTFPSVQKSRQGFDTAVKNFEANNNSVVIAAGNEGEVHSKLESSNHGLKVDVPADFTRNILENDQVTSVGSTRWYNNNGQLSEYRAKMSSGSSGIDIHASGSLGFNNPNVSESQGTSFAAPRVAASMAAVHQMHPDWSSDQVEAFVKKNLTHQLATAQGDLSVLDFNKNYEFLKNNVY